MSFYNRNMVPLRRWCWSIRGRFRAKIEFSIWTLNWGLNSSEMEVWVYLLGTEHGLRGREGVTCSRRITSRVSFWELSFDDDPISDWNHSFGLLLLEIGVIEIIFQQLVASSQLIAWKLTFFDRDQQESTRNHHNLKRKQGYSMSPSKKSALFSLKVEYFLVLNLMIPCCQLQGHLTAFSDT